jgi:hypothetical protein
MEDHSCMYHRVFPNGGLRADFLRGVDYFVNKARELPYYALEGWIRCPWVNCRSMKLLTELELKFHLYKKGFKPRYWV